MPSSRALVFFVALGAAGCGLVSGLDAIVLDGGQQADASSNDVVLDPSTADVPLVTEDAGNALASSGGCSFIAGNSPLSLSASAFTIELWLIVKAQIQGAEVSPILWQGGRTTAEPGWTLALSAQGLEFCVADSSAAKCSTPYAVTPGDLLHLGIISTIAGTRSVGIYQRDATKKDGTHILAGELVGGVVDWGTTSTFTVGGSKGSALCANATTVVIDDLRVYNAAIAPGQLDTDMGAIPCNTTGLVAYFKFDEGASSTNAADCTTSKLVLTVGANASFVPSPFP